MTDPHQIAVRLRALDGTWETLGTGRYVGILPEAVQFDENAWGPNTCSFTLKRSPGAPHADLRTWTPVEVEVAGELAWDGRIKETPAQEAVSVQCEGWQYHLDDDQFSRLYVYPKMDKFRDHRSFPTSNLTYHPTAFQIQTGSGSLIITAQKDQEVFNGYSGAATLDLGSASTFGRVSIDVATNNAGSFQVELIASMQSDYLGVGSEDELLMSLPVNSGTFGGFNNVVTLSYAPLVQKRYLHLVLRALSSHTPGAESWVKLTGCRLYLNDDWEASNQSAAKAGMVIRDVLSWAPLLSEDTSQVEDGEFIIPEMWADGGRTPREVMNAVNAYENYDLRVELGRRLRFRPRAAAPTIEIGDWEGSNFSDASLNSGDGLVNTVLVTGTGPDGEPITVPVGASGPPWAIDDRGEVINPSFDTDTSDWNPIIGTLTRDTSVYRSAPASGRINQASGGWAGAFPVTGLIRKQVYLVRVFFRMGATVTQVAMGASRDSHINTAFIVTGTLVDISNLSTGAFGSLDLVFTAQDTSHWISFVVLSTGGSDGTNLGYLDDVTLYRAAGTLPDRWGFRKTVTFPVSSTLTLTSGRRVAELYLAGHRTVPFRGSFQAVGQGGVRKIMGGGGVHPAHIHGGGLVRCAHRIDPDTGSWGRDGQIATVSYVHDTLTSQVSLDENRQGLETLLSRLAVVTSGT